MPITLAEKIEKRAKVAAEVKTLSQILEGDGETAARDWTPEESSAFDLGANRYKVLTVEIDADRASESERATALERATEIDRHQAAVVKHPLTMQTDPEPDDVERITASQRDQSAAIAGWSRCAPTRLDSATKPERAAADRVGMDLAQDVIAVDVLSNAAIRLAQHAYRTMHPTVAYSRALSTLAGGSGGVMVPPGFIDMIEVNKLFIGSVQRVASPLRTATGEDITWPTMDGTSQVATIIGENKETSTTGNDPSYSSVTFRAHEFTTGIVLVPNRLIQDSHFDMNALLAEHLATSLARGQNAYFTTGTGSGQPRGIVTDAGAGVTASSASEIQPDELVSLIHSVDVAYREAPSVGWMLHDTTLEHIRKFKTGDGQYMFQPGLQLGIPATLLGYPMSINNNMPEIGSATDALIFGQLNKYHVRTVAGLTLHRLFERFATANQVGYMAVERADGATLDAGTKPIKKLTMAA